MVHHSQGLTLWFTGLSGAGKTTLAPYVQKQLQAAGHVPELLDSDTDLETIEESAAKVSHKLAEFGVMCSIVES
ncbi:MAG: adenylyl-sulfate kinase [Thermosynechococcus sp.]|uniref:adenylyl-sulfate kinase n=1 Tax=Thermosynechococcus sp. TaxID=2814275 RepID=UPI00391D492A